MKFVINPVVRVLFVIIVFIMLPIIYIGEGMLSLWFWDKKHICAVNDCLTKHFIAQDESVNIGEKYWVYKTPLDYILNRKSYRVKTNPPHHYYEMDKCCQKNSSLYGRREKYLCS